MNELNVTQLIGFAITAGAAWGGVKAALNGTRETVRRIERKVDQHHEEASERLGRVEAEVQGTRERVVRLETRLE